MDLFRVPRRETPVRLLLDDARVLDGGLFTALTGPDGLPGRVVDRLNDPTEEFVALRSEQERFLVNKSGIVTVRLEGDPEEILGPEAATGRHVPVRLSLAGGTALVGRLVVVMPSDRSRVIDYLNAIPRFFPLVGEKVVTLVQKSFVVSVRDLEGE